MTGGALLLVKELPLSSPKSAKAEDPWAGELSRQPERFLAGKAGDVSKKGEFDWKGELF